MKPIGLRLLFYLGIVATALGGLGLCVSSIPSDPFVDWTVINNTDSELLTWLHKRDCSRLVGYRGEYSEEERVAPGAVLQYSDYGFSDECVQVASTNRRIVSAQTTAPIWLYACRNR